MSMSDCEMCWSTPCRCGAEGYFVVSGDERIKNLTQHQYDRLQAALEAKAKELLDAEGYLPPRVKPKPDMSKSQIKSTICFGCYHPPHKAGECPFDHGMYRRCGCIIGES